MTVPNHSYAAAKRFAATGPQRKRGGLKTYRAEEIAQRDARKSPVAFNQPQTSARDAGHDGRHEAIQNLNPNAGLGIGARKLKTESTSQGIEGEIGSSSLHRNDLGQLAPISALLVGGHLGLERPTRCESSTAVVERRR
ncbi:hypothetical protein [Humisphaera borealis]|uniref:Uncharacterized protein n=1 Tax=Humisphaera borealis TaxID=2807512 RepID=A0A7M2WZQ5_9BACT|nr:hypothetical protein [Humisphaera borealis]QOV90955.1 hypothetical protein IPV69_06230 [Humisphaera borealis]